ncbi:DHA2 family efflux MFS transporter permease subunit [Streptomyces sp. SID3343]|uniref:DHA2 family efflux MFS transporter permease subunit n=1 Tax=Streptomyces sp. SID3343 TaxID=2690260 RepID=UPI0013711AEC|nr:DHA2 family efflux MFS transporter permease subunit [Streptomyces sp. SID3343]MYW00965.1 DHA2 family efflux MFS transporter permease subunit [Streptomyces sp. SID3343]
MMSIDESKPPGAESANAVGVPRQVWVVAAAVVVGLGMALLDTTIVNVALDAIARDLHCSLGAIQWVSTVYLLTLAVVIPLAGWSTERFGSRRVWMAAVTVFTAGSALCGAAWSIDALIAFRVLQGIGGGLIMPVGMSLIARASGPERMGRVMSVVGVPMLLVPVLGPVLGGIIVDTISWRWIFYINVVLGAVALTLAARLLPRDPTETTAPPLDRLGLVTLAPGLAAVVFGLSEVQSHGGPTAPAAWGPIVGGAALVVLFVLHARRAPHALIDVRLFRRAPFLAAATTIFFAGAALYGALFVTPLYFQLARGESPLTAGLLVAPQGIGAALAMPLAGRLTDRIGGGIVAATGLFICAAATVPLTLVTGHTPYAWLVVVLLVRGLGIGASLMPTTAAAYATLQRSEIPRATGAISVLQQLGGSIGVTALAVSLQSRTHATGSASRAAAFTAPFTWALALAAIALAAAIVLAVAGRRAARE